MSEARTFLLDGEPVPFEEGQTVLQAALSADRFIPHLCYHPEFKPHGSCKVCTIRIGPRTVAACTTPASEGLDVQSNTAKLNDVRRTLVQMLFAEGNHFCPSCEASGRCMLQAVGYELEVTTAGFRHMFPVRPVDSSHPDILLDFNRCILCELCVRASSEVDGKHVFALSGRGLDKHLIVNSESGELVDTDVDVHDKAIEVCPVGVIIKKGVGFSTPIGERLYDKRSFSEQAKRGTPRSPTSKNHDQT